MNRAMQKGILAATLLGAASHMIVFACCSSFGIGSAAREPFILYSLTLADARLSVVHVCGTIVGSAARMASLRAFAGVDGTRLEPIGFTAAGPDGEKLDARIADGAWVVENGGRDFTFEYDVALTIENRYSPDVRGMMTFLGDDRCRILGKDVLLIPEIPVASGIMVDVSMRPQWRLSASSPHVRNRVVVPDLAELPFTMTVSGEYRIFGRSIGGSEIVLAIAGSWSFSDEEFFDVVCRIVSEEISLFGSCPRARYLIVCDGNPVMGGSRFDYYGIHYGGSMILLLDRRLDRSELMDTPMAIIAHEFFHNWNGEALGAAGRGFLWFTEGVTNYISYHVLREANVITHNQWESRRCAISERYHANPYAKRVTIGEAGNNDMGDKDMINLLYDGGFLAAEALDARLRGDTGGRVTLIDVLKRMYENARGSRTADEDSFLAAASQLGADDLAGYVRALVHTLEPKPLAPRASSLE